MENFMENCSSVSNCQESITSFDKGLVQHRPVIIWSNEDLIKKCASITSELNQW